MAGGTVPREPTAYRLAYDGRGYHGFQRQSDVPTVEGALFDALRSLEVLPEDATAPPDYAAAGRTDAGVSAVAQTVAFEAPRWLTPVVLSHALPPDVAAWARARVPTSFHATHDAVGRHYRYHLPAAGLDEARLRFACDALSGAHDVRNLAAVDGAEPRRTRIAVRRAGDWFELDFRGRGFARQQVRRTVGAVRAVAAGEAPRARLGRLLEATAIPGHLAPAVAPAEPLVLVDVRYHGLDFDVDAEATTHAREAMAMAREAALTRARVLDDLGAGVGAG
ncbi:MAG: tRNA pseudouridine(38-40) synthase TruA [Halobacteriales archaeon]